MARKVRTNSWYQFNPVLFDIVNPPFGVRAGDKVKVVKLPGCPKPNVMGMCHVADVNGKFAGMVCTNSLIPVRKV